MMSMKRILYPVGLLSLALLTVGSSNVKAQWWSRNQIPAYSAMSGTYELESTRGGNPQRAADTATRSLPPGQRDRAYQALLARLDPPQVFSIDRQGRSI